MSWALPQFRYNSPLELYQGALWTPSLEAFWISPLTSNKQSYSGCHALPGQRSICISTVLGDFIGGGADFRYKLLQKLSQRYGSDPSIA